jgi:hypothetical protein
VLFVQVSTHFFNHSAVKWSLFDKANYFYSVIQNVFYFICKGFSNQHLSVNEAVCCDARIFSF